MESLWHLHGTNIVSRGGGMGEDEHRLMRSGQKSDREDDPEIRFWGVILYSCILHNCPTAPETNVHLIELYSVIRFQCCYK